MASSSSSFGVTANSAPLLDTPTQQTCFSIFRAPASVLPFHTPDPVVQWLGAPPRLNRFDLKSLRLFLVAAEAFYRSPEEPSYAPSLRALIAPKALAFLHNSWSSIDALKGFVQSCWGYGLLPMIRQRTSILPASTPTLNMYWFARRFPRRVQFCHQDADDELMTTPHQCFGYNTAVPVARSCDLCTEPDDCNLSCDHGFCRVCLTTGDPHLAIAVSEGVCPYALVIGCCGVQPPRPPIPPEAVENVCRICMQRYKGRFVVTLYCNHQLCSECYASVRQSVALIRRCPFCNDPRLGQIGLGYRTTVPYMPKVRFDEPEIIDLVSPPRPRLPVDIPIAINDDHLALFLYMYDGDIPLTQDWEQAFGPGFDFYHMAATILTVPWQKYAALALEQLKYLQVLYRVKFQRVVLGSRLAQCDAFSTSPTKSFAKYKANFSDATRFLKVSESLRKQYFFDGIPETSQAFRDYLLPLVAASDLTFDGMLLAATLTLEQSVRLGSSQFLSDTKNATGKKRALTELSSFPIQLVISCDEGLTIKTFDDYVQRFDNAWGSCPVPDQIIFGRLKAFFVQGLCLRGLPRHIQKATRIRSAAYRWSVDSTASFTELLAHIRRTLASSFVCAPTIREEFQACQTGNCIKAGCHFCVAHRTFSEICEEPSHP